MIWSPSNLSTKLFRIIIAAWLGFVHVGTHWYRGLLETRKDSTMLYKEQNSITCWGFFHLIWQHAVLFSSKVPDWTQYSLISQVSFSVIAVVKRVYGFIEKKCSSVGFNEWWTRSVDASHAFGNCFHKCNSHKNKQCLRGDQVLKVIDQNCLAHLHCLEYFVILRYTQLCSGMCKRKGSLQNAVIHK